MTGFKLRTSYVEISNHSDKWATATTRHIFLFLDCLHFFICTQLLLSLSQFFFHSFILSLYPFLSSHRSKVFRLLYPLLVLLHTYKRSFLFLSLSIFLHSLFLSRFCRKSLSVKINLYYVLVMRKCYKAFEEQKMFDSNLISLNPAIPGLFFYPFSFNAVDSKISRWIDLNLAMEETALPTLP